VGSKGRLPGIDGSLGFYEGQWGVDLYFDIYRSATSYPLAGVQLSTAQRFDMISAGLLFSRHF
jgi:hypothetical protein